MQPFDKERAKRRVKARLEVLEGSLAAQGSPWVRDVLKRLKDDLEPLLAPELPDWLTIDSLNTRFSVIDDYGDSISVNVYPASKSLGLEVPDKDGLIEFNEENAKRVEVMAEAMLAWSRGGGDSFIEHINKLKSEGV